MKRYICRRCGFQSFIDPGERCPGCGYFFSYMNHQPQWTQEMLGQEEAEIPIRRLRCAIMGQDDQKDGALADCTITNRSLRLRLCGYYRGGRALAWSRLTAFPIEIVLPYKRLTKITQGTHNGQPARFFTYHHSMIGPVNLWFFVDLGVEKKYPDVDAQVAQLVGAYLPSNENRYGEAVSAQEISL
ncbi:MAG: hypothetical protein IKU34_04445 [Clostridia bacterium]|nr:hypothetical protein [Clostridia bacterium]